MFAVDAASSWIPEREVFAVDAASSWIPEREVSNNDPDSTMVGDLHNVPSYKELLYTKFHLISVPGPCGGVRPLYYC